MASVQQIKFIRRAKSLGFSLQEIAELLALQDDEAHSDRAQIKTLAENKLTEIVARLHDLQRMRDVLAAAVMPTPTKQPFPKQGWA